MDQPSWVDLLARIRGNDQQASEELDRLLLPGFSYFLCRQLGPHNLDNKVRDSFRIVIEAIRSGDLREPEKLMGVARAVVRRQTSNHMGKTVGEPQEKADVDDQVLWSDRRMSPETTAVAQEEEDIAVHVLETIPPRYRESLSRLYLQAQAQEQICSALQVTARKFQLQKSRAKFRFDELRNRMLARRNCLPSPSRSVLLPARRLSEGDEHRV